MAVKLGAVHPPKCLKGIQGNIRAKKKESPGEPLQAQLSAPHAWCQLLSEDLRDMHSFRPWNNPAGVDTVIPILQMKTLSRDKVTQLVVGNTRN